VFNDFYYFSDDKTGVCSRISISLIRLIIILNTT